MKITIGIDQRFTTSDIKELINLGVDEFYFSIMPPEWTSVYGYTVSTNRRYCITEHYLDWDKLQEAVNTIHKAGKKTIIAFNALYYTGKQMPLIIDYVKNVCDIGVDALIIADIELLLSVVELGYKIDIHISSESGTYNSKTAELFSSFGAKRIIFPGKWPGADSHRSDRPDWKIF
ncbi:MAG: Peptidase family U32 [Bacteroidetes bacterium ADurb.Bin408]|nr:MAG: Peptidase family U32 [Bacteroidetes bacterium ADurb.Bin408]